MENKTKFYHNKKRNTAVLLEVVTREIAKAAFAKNDKLSKQWSELLKYFYSGSVLCEELKLYEQIEKTRNITKEQANRIINLAVEQHNKLDQVKIFETQTSLISKINKLSKDAFTAFVPNYRDLASIYQLFHQKAMPLKSRVLLESALIENMCKRNQEEQSTNLEPLDLLTYKTFINKFNEKYSKELLEEQKKMIACYVLSLEDNGAGLKLYLNEEVGRLKDVLSKENEHISSNKELSEKKDKILFLLESVKNRKREIDEELILNIMKVQSLVSELENN